MLQRLVPVAANGAMRDYTWPFNGDAPLWHALLVVQEQFVLSARAATVAVALDVPRSDRCGRM